MPVPRSELSTNKNRKINRNRHK